MSLHAWSHHGLRKTSKVATPPSRSALTGAELPQAKKVLLYARDCFYSVRLFAASRLWPAKLLCQSGGSPGKTTGVYWPILVAIPF